MQQRQTSATHNSSNATQPQQTQTAATQQTHQQQRNTHTHTPAATQQTNTSSNTTDTHNIIATQQQHQTTLGKPVSVGRWFPYFIDLLTKSQPSGRKPLHWGMEHRRTTTITLNDPHKETSRSAPYFSRVLLACFLLSSFFVFADFRPSFACPCLCRVAIVFVHFKGNAPVCYASNNRQQKTTNNSSNNTQGNQHLQQHNKQTTAKTAATTHRTTTHTQQETALATTNAAQATVATAQTTTHKHSNTTQILQPGTTTATHNK